MGRYKDGEIPWKKVYERFEFYYPRIAKKTCHWQPYDFGQIMIWLEDGRKFVYDYDAQMGCFIDGNWKTDDPRRVEHVRINMAEKIQKQLAEPYIKPWYKVPKPEDGD